MNLAELINYMKNEQIIDNTLQVEGKSNLVRDKISKAIISTDEESRKKYLMRKRVISSTDNRIEALERQVLELQAQVKLLIYRLESASIIV